MNIIAETMNLINYVICDTNNISIMIITVVAGIFGFIIAAIPLTIQLLEIKDNYVIQKINENKFMKKKIFYNYIDTLKSAFYVIVFFLLIEIFKENICQNIFLEIVCFILYILFAYSFLKNLYRLISILKELIFTYMSIK
jgi:hypothetical protein